MSIIIDRYSLADTNNSMTIRVTLIDGETGEMGTASGSANAHSVKELYREADAIVRLRNKGVGGVESEIIAAVSKTWMRLHETNVNRRIFMKEFGL